MASITLRGREIPLLYTVLEMKTLQEEIGPLGQLRFIITGQDPEDEKNMDGYGTPEHLGAVVKMVRILGNAGLEESGHEPDLTDRKIMRALKPGQIIDVIGKCMEAMNDGMASEIPEKEDDGPVDVTLEEINKKKEPEG